MVTTSPSTALIPAAPVLSNAERLALAGFLAGYRGLTRDAYELDLRQFASWCHLQHLRLFGARRSDIKRSPTSRGSAAGRTAPNPGKLTQRAPLRRSRTAVLRGQWPLGAYQLKHADQVDLVRHDLPLGASETTGSG
jgi:hypothetical protein